MVPMVGRGERRADLRIYTLDPLDRTFWPFPQEGVVVDESGRPAGPGEEPGELTDPLGSPDAGLVSEQIRLLGSPGLSRIVDLPLGPDRDAATFGLDLSDPLAELVGKGHAGTFLVGLQIGRAHV